MNLSFFQYVAILNLSKNLLFNIFLGTPSRVPLRITHGTSIPIFMLYPLHNVFHLIPSIKKPAGAVAVRTGA